MSKKKIIKKRPTQKQPKILIIDDQALELAPLAVILESLGCDVTLSFDGFNARQNLLSKKFDLIVLDWMMPEIGGQETLLALQEYLVELQQKVSYVTFSGLQPEEIVLPETTHLQCLDHWQKPYNLHTLTKSAAKVIARL